MLDPFAHTCRLLVTIYISHEDRLLIVSFVPRLIVEKRRVVADLKSAAVNSPRQVWDGVYNP